MGAVCGTTTGRAHRGAGGARAADDKRRFDHRGEPAIYEYRARVVSIHDGDTGRFDIDLGFGIWTANQSLRFAGIDAPELGTDAGRAARDYVRALLPVGLAVVIRTHRDADDKYGRLLADIYFSHDEFAAYSVNANIVTAGHAKPYDGGAR